MASRRACRIPTWAHILILPPEALVPNAGRYGWSTSPTCCNGSRQTASAAMLTFWICVSMQLKASSHLRDGVHVFRGGITNYADMAARWQVKL